MNYYFSCSLKTLNRKIQCIYIYIRLPEAGVNLCADLARHHLIGKMLLLSGREAKYI